MFTQERLFITAVFHIFTSISVVNHREWGGDNLSIHYITLSKSSTYQRAYNGSHSQLSQLAHRGRNRSDRLENVRIMI